MHIKDAAAVSLSGPDRNINEDAALVLEEPTMGAVADGMGGPGLGNVASSMAMVSFQRRAGALARLAKQAERQTSSRARLALGRELERILETINGEIADSARRSERVGMATTTAVVLIAGGRAHVAHVGAARAYLLRDGRLRILTEDHTVGMARVRQGLMRPDEYRDSPLRQRLYQALGTGPDVDVDVAEVALADGDVVLLCTDGVYDKVDLSAMEHALEASTAALAGQALIDEARRAGATDDASVVVLCVSSDTHPELLDEIASVLADTFLFKALSDAERLLVAPYLDHRMLPEGQVLFREGDPGDAFYVVVDGLVRITKGETPLVDIGPGGSFGELCLARPVKRSATITALEETLVFELSRDHFGLVVNRRPVIGTKLLLAALDHTGVRLRDLTDRLAVVEALATGERSAGERGVLEALILAAQGKLG